MTRALHLVKRGRNACGTGNTWHVGRGEAGEAQDAGRLELLAFPPNVSRNVHNSILPRQRTKAGIPQLWGDALNEIEYLFYALLQVIMMYSLRT